eukprot:TRINITY_DN6974_c0_g1_i1.p1 TRINITY_DN6974_c0_g1~~TRINITY_DN6974_c0_g1_i1.p1  ORF type:complete len:373 (+),score=68.21 TRINITY_DN6974_c0_g1_i1:18-1136(+)
MSYSAEMRLDPELLASLRRGRSRLRELQEATGASLKLNRVQGVLSVLGSASSIAAVRFQLECMSGCRRVVTSAAWTELMRMRKIETGMTALNRIQEQSGCRVHIERSKHEVRLFGPRATASVADRLLDQLEKLCIEQHVPAASCANLAESKLEAIASGCGVTFKLEQGGIRVLGLKFAVAEAVNDLIDCMVNPEFKPREPLAEPSPRMIAALSELQATADEAAAVAAASQSPCVRGQADFPDESSQDQSAFTQRPRPSGNTARGTARDPMHVSGAEPIRCWNCGCTNVRRFCGTCGMPSQGPPTSQKPVSSDPYGSAYLPEMKEVSSDPYGSAYLPEMKAGWQEHVPRAEFHGPGQLPFPPGLSALLAAGMV